jgi:hypothetical protein
MWRAEHGSAQGRMLMVSFFSAEKNVSQLIFVKFVEQIYLNNLEKNYKRYNNPF